MILIANLVQQCGGTKVYRKETIKLNYSPKRLPQKHYTSVESVADTHSISTMTIIISSQCHSTM